VRCVLGTFGRLVLELGEGLFNVTGYGHVDGARFVVPLESETKVTGARPLGGDGEERLEGGGEMLGVVAAGVLDSEVINNQTEHDGTGSMGEETVRVFCSYVAVLGEMLDESIVGELASLGKTVHSFADFNEDVSIVDEGLELVLFHDAGGNYFDWDSHVLVVLHGSVQVEVFDVDRHELCVLGVDRTL
jgi:hypothetical protein